MAFNVQGISNDSHGPDVPGEPDDRWTLQPVIAYQLGKGWALSAGDLQYAYDWEADRWINVPVGFQIGKVTRLGKLPLRFSINPQYNLLDDPGLSRWSISFTMTALFPSF